VDIGAGEGLIAFRAIDRVGPSLRVILTDISSSMLCYVEHMAIKLGVERQCRFLQCAADKLEAIEDASVDVITTRSVLAYVADKSAALREFNRILKPGGRISLAEPILRDEAMVAKALKQLVDFQSGSTSQDQFVRLLHRWKSAQYPDNDEKISNSPITNFTERDLVDYVHKADFADIHLELHIDVLPNIFPSWEAFIATAPHPWAPSLKHIFEEQFTEDERQFFEKTLRPTIEDPKGVSLDRIAYLTGIKPIG
jgi:ubiquinone/menaquinone biosynthesis C-methylase UbiE